MKEIELTIKIYEEQYEHIKSMTMDTVKDYHLLLYGICERIKNGTPREDYEPLYNCENWIPCSERLPEKGGDYLITISFDVGESEPVREVYKGYFCALSQKWLYHEEEDVIAWMPLPEPWKGE